MVEIDSGTRISDKEEKKEVPRKHHNLKR